VLNNTEYGITCHQLGDWLPCPILESGICLLFCSVKESLAKLVDISVLKLLSASSKDNADVMVRDRS